MIDHKLRQVKEKVLAPAANRMHSQITPLHVSLFGFAVGLLAAYAILRGWHITAVAFWLFSRFLDGLDGTLARVSHRQTDFGAYIDILFDYILYTLIPFVLVISLGTGYTMLAFLISTFYINTMSWMYLSSLLEQRDQGAKSHGELTSVTMPPSIIEGTETIAFYTLFILFPDSLVLLFGLMGGLVLVGVVQRVIFAAHRLNGH